MDGEIKGRYPLLLSILSSSFYAKDYEGKGTTQEDILREIDTIEGGD